MVAVLKYYHAPYSRVDFCFANRHCEQSRDQYHHRVRGRRLCPWSVLFWRTIWVEVSLTSLRMDQDVTMAVEIVILDPICELIPICTDMSAPMYNLWMWASVPPFISHECHVCVTHRSLS